MKQNICHYKGELNFFSYLGEKMWKIKDKVWGVREPRLVEYWD